MTNQQRPSNFVTNPPTVANQMRMALVLFVVAFVMFLAGNEQHYLWDRDEPRYATATREMLETGNWIIPHFNGGVRLDKPVLIYWLISMPVMIFGESEFSFRFIAALCGALRVPLMFLFAIRMGAGRQGALLAAAISGFSLMMMLISKATTIDSALVLTIIVAMWFYWERIAYGFQWWKHIGFWVAMALAVMLKGPPGPLVAGTAALSLRIWLRIANQSKDTGFADESTGQAVGRSLVGILVFLIWTLPWVYVTYRAMPDFISEQVQRHVFHRTTRSMDGHAGPFYYYFVALLPCLLPFAAAAICGLAWAARMRASIAVKFLWCWFVPTFIVFAFVKTKLPHYLAPLLPAIGLMASLWWEERDVARDKVWRWVGAGFTVLAGVGVMVGMHLFYFRMLDPTNHDISRGPLLAAALLLAGPMVLGSLFWLLRRDRTALAVWTVGWFCAVIFGLYVAFPPLNKLRPSRQLGDWIRKNSLPSATVMMVEYEEPSLVYYSGRQIVDLGKNDRAQAFKALNDPLNPAVLVTTADRWQKFQDEYKDLEKGTISPKIRVGRTLNGVFQFEKGQWMDLRIICNWPKPEDSGQDTKPQQ